MLEAVGRLWLAVVLLVAAATPAFALRPHVPSPPTITSAYLEIGEQRTSSGLYDVERLELTGTFDRYTSFVRIRIGDSVIQTTPDQLSLVRPQLLSPVGTVTLELTSSDSRLDSEPTRITVVAQRHHAFTGCGQIYVVALLFGGVMGLVLLFGVLFEMRATQARRARARGEIEPSALPSQAAEDHIRIVALRSLFAIVVVAALVVVAVGFDAVFLPIFGAPVLGAVALPAIVRVVNAGRAIVLLHRPAAAASTRYDQLEVTAADRHVTLRSSPRLVERARQAALPRATL